jgi:aspartyl protease family protein
MDRRQGVDARVPHSGMGHFRVPIAVSALSGAERFVAIDALVDTGATYTWIPRGVLDGLGIVPQEERRFVLADGREVRYPVAWVKIKVGEVAQPTIVVFGEPASQPILGVVTLEEFLLAADPVRRRLIPVPGLLQAGAVMGSRITGRR